MSGKFQARQVNILYYIVKKAKENEMKTYTLEIKMYEEEYSPRFSFNAKNEGDAKDKASSWARYHGMIRDDFRVREATENEAENWLHNEYIR